MFLATSDPVNDDHNFMMAYIQRNAFTENFILNYQKIERAGVFL